MNTIAFKNRFAVAAMALVFIAGAIAPAWAHHSFAMYDLTQEKTMTGKLIRFVLGANHSQFIYEVVKPDGTIAKDEKGNAVTWNAETTSAQGLVTQGITVESFKIGTIFTAKVAPLRDGRNGGALRGSVIMCGMTLPKGGCTEQTGKVYR